MMALGVLKGLGLNAAELAKAGNGWLDIPNTANAAAKMNLTQRQAEQLEKLAAARNTSVDTLLNEEFTKLVNSLLKSANP
jgi:hypothetical protein